MFEVISFLKGLFGLSADVGPTGAALDEDLVLAWMDPPADPTDEAGWDEYWHQHLAHGLGPPIFDMFCDDRELVAAMSDNGMKRVLRAGNGCSMEPRALAAAGFDVTAVDISQQALDIAQRYPPSNELLQRFIEPDAVRSGGSVTFVHGNLLDASIAPGLFDLVIERRTAQNYGHKERAAFMSALADRLSPDGIFFSHCHDNRWRPGKPRRHETSKWFQANGWLMWAGGPGEKPPGGVAWLFTTTG